MALTLAKLKKRFKSKMQKFRRSLIRNGYNLSVTSYIRTPEHNRQVEGAEESRHLIGLAADFIPLYTSRTFQEESDSPDYLWHDFIPRLAESLGLRLIYGMGYIHIDLKMTEEEMRWVSALFSLSKGQPEIRIVAPTYFAGGASTPSALLPPPRLLTDDPRNVSDWWGFLKKKKPSVVLPPGTFSR